MSLDNPPWCRNFYPRPLECKTGAKYSIAVADCPTVVFCAVALLAPAVQLRLLFAVPRLLYKYDLRLWIGDQPVARPFSKHRLTEAFWARGVRTHNPRIQVVEETRPRGHIPYECVLCMLR